MKVNKILCCCGSGLGSSMLVRLNADKVLKKLGYDDIEVANSSVSEAVAGNADVFIVAKDLEDFVSGLDNTIILNDIMNLEELETKLLEIIEK